MIHQTPNGNEVGFGIDWRRFATWFRLGLLTAGTSLFLLVAQLVVQGAGEAVAIVFAAFGAEPYLDNLFLGMLTVDLVRLAVGLAFVMGVGCLFGYITRRSWSREVDWSRFAAGMPGRRAKGLRFFLAWLVLLLLLYVSLIAGAAMLLSVDLIRADYGIHAHVLTMFAPFLSMVLVALMLHEHIFALLWNALASPLAGAGQAPTAGRLIDNSPRIILWMANAGILAVWWLALSAKQ